MVKAMSDYDVFAKYYDSLMYDVDYGKVCRYVLKIAEKYGVTSPALALDLGCGTGKMCIDLAEQGFDMIGIDISLDMLSKATENAEAAGKNILFLNQDMTDFELYGTVAMITCLTDGVNHITDVRKLKRLLKLALNYLDYGGVFIFDINSEEKLSETLGNNVFYDIDDDVSYIWQSNYNAKSRICRCELTFFIKEENGLYKKSECSIREKAYGIQEMKEFLKEAGFINIRSYKKGERIYFAGQKPKL